jgi:molybdopterin-binding protein
MNLLSSTLIDIVSSPPLYLLKFSFEETSLVVISLDAPTDLQLGDTVQLSIKPHYIALSKSFSGELSYTNQIRATVLSVQKGKLLSSIKLQVGESILESIITQGATERMQLKRGDWVTMLIKESEISLLRKEESFS